MGPTLNKAIMQHTHKQNNNIHLIIDVCNDVTPEYLRINFHTFFLTLYASYVVTIHYIQCTVPFKFVYYKDGQAHQYD